MTLERAFQPLRNAKLRGSRLRALVAILWGTSWAALSRRAIPPYAALALVAVVVFGPGGTSPGELLPALEATPVGRLTLLLSWALLLAPAARAFVTATPRYLLALPVPPILGVSLFAAGHMLLNVGIGLLFGAAYGALSGFVALLFASAIHANIRGNTPTLRTALALAPLVLLWAMDERGIAAGACAGGLLAIGERSAWRSFAADPALAARRWMSGHAPVALALAHLHYLVRTDGAVATRGVMGAAAAGGVSGLVVRNNASLSLTDAACIALLSATFPLLVIGQTLASRAIASERQLHALLTLHAVPERTRALAQLLYAAILGGVAGGIVGAVSATFAPPLRALWFVWPAVAFAWGVGTGSSAFAFTRVNGTDDGGIRLRDASVLALGPLLALVVATRALAIGVGLYALLSATAAMFVPLRATPLRSRPRG